MYIEAPGQHFWLLVHLHGSHTRSLLVEQQVSSLFSAMSFLKQSLKAGD